MNAVLIEVVRWGMVVGLGPRGLGGLVHRGLTHACGRFPGRRAALLQRARPGSQALRWPTLAARPALFPLPDLRLNVAVLIHVELRYWVR